MKTMFIPHSDYLEHHGIKGQKWGLRRYQNPDGSYTEAGKKRYAKEINKKIAKTDSAIYKEARWVGYRAAAQANRPNSAKALKKVYEDPDYVKANKAYSDAYADHENLMDNALIKYGGKISSWPSGVYEKCNRSAVKLNNAAKKEHEEFIKALNRHEPELLSAKLADIGEQDTELGRQIIKEIGQKRHGDQWWLSY